MSNKKNPVEKFIDLLAYTIFVLIVLPAYIWLKRRLKKEDENKDD